jgi:phage-related protein
MPKKETRAGCLYAGSKLSIFYAVREGGSQPAREFLKNLKQENPRHSAKILTLVKRLGDYGQIANKKQFTNERVGIFAFKSYQVRVLGFYGPERTFILTHGLIKKQQKLPSSEWEKARKIQTEFDRLLRDGCVVLDR